MRITLINHFRVLSFHLMGTLMMLACLWWLGFDKDIVTIFLIFWLIYTIPALYLHIEYYLKNRDKEYNITNNELVISQNGVDVYYSVNEIKEIVFYMSSNAYQRSVFRFLAIESYSFARILTNTEEEIIITCLVDPNLENTLRQLKGVVFYREQRFFCTLSSR